MDAASIHFISLPPFASLSPSSAMHHPSHPIPSIPLIFLMLLTRRDLMNNGTPACRLSVTCVVDIGVGTLYSVINDRKKRML